MSHRPGRLFFATRARYALRNEKRGAAITDTFRLDYAIPAPDLVTYVTLFYDFWADVAAIVGPGRQAPRSNAAASAIARAFGTSSKKGTGPKTDPHADACEASEFDELTG